MDTTVDASLAAEPDQNFAVLSDFDSVVSLYRPRIYRFALASLRSVDAAESLTQDCFLKAYRCRDQFRGDSRLSTWLMRIAINLVRDQLRNRRLQFWKRTQAGDGDELMRYVPDRTGTPEQRILLGEQVQAIWTAARHLPDRQRTVFLLRFLEEMELDEIALATGLRSGTVKVHLHRAVHAVRTRMGLES